MNLRLGVSQFSKYTVVGLTSNLLLYVAYLAITAIGMGPKLAMSAVYVAGVAQTFIFNKRWSFQSSKNGQHQFLKYCIAYGVGYLINWGALYIFVYILRTPHQIVQAAMILVVAAVIFILQKFWVFK